MSGRLFAVFFLSYGAKNAIETVILPEVEDK